MEPQLTFQNGQNRGRLAGQGDGLSDVASLGSIGDGLAPIVRLALRRGEGLPPVVRWVRRTFAAMAGGRAVPPEQYADAITEVLRRKLQGSCRN